MVKNKLHKDLGEIFAIFAFFAVKTLFKKRLTTTILIGFVDNGQDENRHPI